MSLSVEDVLDLPIMKLAKVKAGKEHLKEKVVEWISVIEMPVENFVRKNEFVLSTCIGCEEDPESLEQFALDVIQSGASVLAIATGRYVYVIPDRVIQLAKKEGIIIIEVPWEIRFGDIMQAVMHRITLDRQGERQQGESVRQQLINCVLQDKGLSEIAHSLYRHIKIPIAIADHKKTIRANRYMKKDLLQIYSNDTETQLHLIPNTTIPFHEHPLYYHLEQYAIKEEDFYQLPILNNHKTQGWLLFQPTNKEQLTWFVMNVLEHALTACALYFVKENAIELTEIRLKDNFVLNLARHQTEIDDQLQSKAKLLGYELKCNYICLVGETTIEDIPSIQDDISESSSLQSLNYYIQKEITYAGQLFNRRTMTTFDLGRVIIYVETDNELAAYTEIAHQFLDTIERRLSELLTGVEFSWGIAVQRESDYPFYDSYKEAKTALEIGLRQNRKGERTFFEDTKINRLLMVISKNAELTDIVNETLQPLLDYDQKRQTDLIYTFMVYNKFKGNVSQTARTLNLHRQSLLHRLRKIESLTDLSLVKSDDTFLLELSTRLWMLNQMT